MILTELLANMLGKDEAALLRENEAQITEIRLRSGRPFQLVLLDKTQRMGGSIEPQLLERIASRLMDNSLYSRERELQQGYFTTSEGCRVGVCGKTVAANGKIESFSDIGSLCIRIPRQVHGCAQELVNAVTSAGLKSLLIISPPGLGKTTMLRELARALSAKGYNIAIADERREIAACDAGVPSMNVGERSDVMDGCPKAVAIPLLVRACAPDVLIADEIGAERDAVALLDAVRCGVKVIASAHANSFEDALQRGSIAPALMGRAFDYCVLLGPTPGRIQYLRKCADGVLNHVEGNIAVRRSAVLCGNRARTVQCAQKEG